ncbi:MAG: hypothetical protein AB8G77_14795 [Rhodothermales bacterium]
MSALLVCTFLLTSGLTPPKAHGQAMPIDARLVHIINYSAGVVKAQWIPYGRRWAIQGTTLKLENEIRAVVGEIKPTGKKRMQNACWTNPPDVYTDVFRLVFDPLEIGRHYDVKLDFYGGFNVNILAPSLDKAYEETVRLANETYPYVRQQAVRDIFISNIENELKGIFDNEDVILLRNLTDGSCQIVQEEETQVPVVDFDSMVLNDIADVVLKEVRSGRRTSMIDEMEDANRQLLDNTVFTSLHGSLKEEEQRSYGFLEFGDADVLRNSMAENGMPSEDVIARLYATGRACRTDVNWDSDQCEMLNEIVDRAYEYVRESALQIDDYGVVRTRMLAQLGEMLSDLYTPVANTRINAMKWDDAHSTSDRIRIGTSIGLGAAALNLTPRQFSEFDINDAESFAVFSLKFYPFAVDKKLPRPYFGRELLARLSLVTGVLIKRRLEFEGEPLKGVAAGLYPMVGGGFDITKNITLQAGAVFFRQPSFLPNNNTSEFKAAPSLSLGFDFDGFNRLRDALRDRSKAPYDQP